MPDNNDAPGIGSVTVTVDDQRQISYSCDPVTPDSNNDITFMLASAGPNKTWTFNSNDPINISNPQDFSYSLASSTQLDVTDTSADEKTVPQHNYTLKIQSQNGDNFDFDPVIKDRT